MVWRDGDAEEERKRRGRDNVKGKGEEEMISVCIASYNGSKYIAEQLSSIVSQLGEDDEVVVSDDGSTDGTQAIVRGFGDGRVRLVANEGRHGVVGNFENSLRESRGDYIFLSDQDDVWLPGKVGLFMERFGAGASIVLSDCRTTDSGLNVLSESKFRSEGVYTGVLRNIAKCSMLGSCMAFRRECMAIFMPFPKSKYIYHDIWIGLTLESAKGITLLETPTMLYRRHDATVTLTSISDGGEKKRRGNSLGHKIVKRFILLGHFLWWYVGYKTGLRGKA